MPDETTRDAARKVGQAIRRLVAQAFDRLDDLSETDGDGIDLSERIALRSAGEDLARLLVKLDTGALRDLTGLDPFPQEVTE